VEDVALAPALEHALLEIRERLLGIDGPVGQGVSILRAHAGFPPGDDIPPERVIDLPAESPNCPG
jgi:hypothetical protein